MGRHSAGRVNSDSAGTSSRVYTQQRRVLVLVAEDPPEYAAYLARLLDVDPQRMPFRAPPVNNHRTGLFLTIPGRVVYFWKTRLAPSRSASRKNAARSSAIRCC